MSLERSSRESRHLRQNFVSILCPDKRFGLGIVDLNERFNGPFQLYYARVSASLDLTLG